MRYDVATSVARMPRVWPACLDVHQQPYLYQSTIPFVKTSYIIAACSCPTGTIYNLKQREKIKMTASSLFCTAKKYMVTALLPFLVLFPMLIAAPVQAESVIATVTVGISTTPLKIIEVNPATNKIYVGNEWSNIVTVIDGVTHTATTVAVDGSPNAIAINEITNHIYVANFQTSIVTVIDGATNSTTAVAVGKFPAAIAINRVTNKIYVVTSIGYGSNSVTVIDGATNATTTVAMGCGSSAIALNPATDKIYVTDYCSNTVTVIDGATNTTTSVAVGWSPHAVAVNPVTNKIYVANANGTVSVIDGATNTVTATLTAGFNPVAVEVNSVTNKIYVMGNSESGTVTVIDGATNNASVLGVGNYPVAIAVNPVTNKIYVALGGNYFVKVIDGANNNFSAIASHRQSDIAVNPVTNRIYVTGYQFDAPNTVSVIGELITDTTPPVISTNQTPSPNANGWNNTDVTVVFSATDDVSTPTCTVNSVTLTAEGAGQVVSTICTDAVGNSASASLTVNIDKTAPALTMPSLASNYTVGSSAFLSFAAADTLSQLASISATLNGNPVYSGSTVTLNQLGTNTFTLTATDTAGNTATQTHQFTVSYAFGGFLPPLTVDGHPTFRLGSVIPVKFELFDASGMAISTAVAHLSLQKFFNDEPFGTPIDATPTGGADSGNLFRYSGGQYIYNLPTKPLSAGIWEIQATLDDGTVRTIRIGLTSR